METYDHPLPASPRVEQAILGSILLDGRKFYECSVLAPEDFSSDRHRRIWRRMNDLAKAGTPIDCVTLMEALSAHGESEATDGLSYLMDLHAAGVEGDGLPAYVDIIREKSALRQLIVASNEAMQRGFQAHEPSNLIISQLVEKTRNIGLADEDTAFSTPREILQSIPGGLDELLAPKSGGNGLKYGFVRLDQATGGMRPGQLIVIGGRPSWGKTAMMLNIAEHVVLREPNKAAAIFSLEMQKRDVLERMYCSRAMVDLQKFQNGYLDDEELDRVRSASADIDSASLHVNDNAFSCMADITARTLQLQEKLGRDGIELGMVGVDYLQLMPTPDLGRNANRVQQVGALSRGLKRLAKESGVPFVVLSQLSRALESRPNHEPNLGDLRESGEIEQDSDLVLFPYRPELFEKEREDLRGTVRLFIAKQRNGPTGEIPLTWVGRCTRFMDTAEDWQREG